MDTCWPELPGAVTTPKGIASALACSGAGDEEAGIDETSAVELLGTGFLGLTLSRNARRRIASVELDELPEL